MSGMANGPGFGTQLKWARERRHLTQQQLADHLGVDRKTVDNWENDRTSPRNRTGALYEWAPELAEEMDPDEAELLASLTRLHEQWPDVVTGADVEHRMRRYRAGRERKRRAASDGRFRERAS